jgi:hypothetical protein
MRDLQCNEGRGAQINKYKQPITTNNNDKNYDYR